MKASFASASIIGDCIVINVGGNKYRLISRIRYATQKVFVLKVMTHGEYDEDKWTRQRHRNQDAPDSKSGPRKRVWVQVPPSVLVARGESRPDWFFASP